MLWYELLGSPKRPLARVCATIANNQRPPRVQHAGVVFVCGSAGKRQEIERLLSNCGFIYRIGLHRSHWCIRHVDGCLRILGFE